MLTTLPSYESSYLEYNCKDAYTTLLIAQRLKKDLRERDLQGFYDRIVQPLTHGLNRLNLKGMWIEEEAKEKAIIALKGPGGEIEQAEDALARIIGRKINVQGKKELGDYLFRELGLAPKERNKDKSGKIDKAFLTDLSLGKIRSRKGAVPLVETSPGNYEAPNIPQVGNLILSIRQKKKMVKTFLESAEIAIDGRVHPSYKIGPATGRIASQKPNFMNIPAGVARSIYTAVAGHKYIYADYSQVELRVLAALANDEILLDTFARGIDIHDRNARTLFGIADSAIVTERQRFFAKMFIYALNYGGSVKGLKERGAEAFADLSLAHMQGMANKYMKAHPALEKWRNGIKTQLFQKGYLFNAFGRPRVFFDPPKEAIRSAYNFPIQSTAADIVNTKFIEIDEKLPNRIVLQVHDCIMLEVPDAEVAATARKFQEILEGPIKEVGGMSFPVKVKVGERWSDFD